MHANALAARCAHHVVEAGEHLVGVAEHEGAVVRTRIGERVDAPAQGADRLLGGVAHRLVRRPERERVRSVPVRTPDRRWTRARRAARRRRRPSSSAGGRIPLLERLELGRELRGRRDRGRGRAAAGRSVPRSSSGCDSASSKKRASASANQRVRVALVRDELVEHRERRYRRCCSGPCGTRAHRRAPASVRTRPVP